MAVSKAAEAGYIKEFTVASNDNKGNISMVGGLVNFQYFESIMDNTVKVSAVFKIVVIQSMERLQIWTTNCY